jgi:hypothetical protein
MEADCSKILLTRDVQGSVVPFVVTIAVNAALEEPSGNFGITCVKLLGVGSPIIYLSSLMISLMLSLDRDECLQSCRWSWPGIGTTCSRKVLTVALCKLTN